MITYVLIVLLPVAGFVLGQWLTPRPRLVWEQKPSGPFVRLIGVSQDGSTVAVAENNQQEITQAILQYSAADGTLIERIELPKELVGAPVRPSQYRPDAGKVYLEVRGKEMSVAEFDLAQRAVTRRYLVGDDRTALQEILARNGRLVVGGTQRPVSTLFVWGLDGTSETAQPSVRCEHGLHAHTLWVHPDGRLAVLLGLTHDRKFQTAVMDLKTPAVEKLAQTFHAVGFGKDPATFTTIRFDDRGFFWERYRLQNGIWTAAERSEPLAPNGRTITVQGTNFVFRGPKWPPGWFTWITNRMSEEWRQDLIRRWGPLPTEVLLVDVETGRVKSRLHLPVSQIYEVALLPDESGIITQNRLSLALWTNSPSHAWPRWMGFGAGLALSIGLFWTHRRRKKAISVRSGPAG